jgi:glycosyltransferase involved in cell wall biosynthesis
VISPTIWQAETFPRKFSPKISVIHDGIDTETIKRRGVTSLTLPNGAQLNSGQKIVTYVARSLEPYRGFHIFMKSIVYLLNQEIDVRVIIVGNSRVSAYSRQLEGGNTWKDLMLAEIRPHLKKGRLEAITFVEFLPYTE